MPSQAGLRTVLAALLGAVLLALPVRAQLPPDGANDGPSAGAPIATAPPQADARTEAAPAAAAPEVDPAAEAALDAFYAARRGAPVWFDGADLRPEAHRLLVRLAEAGADGLDPAAHDPDALAALALSAAHDPSVRAEADRALSRALVRFVLDLRGARGAAAPEFVDPELGPPPATAESILEAAGSGLDLPGLTRMNPVYLNFRRLLEAHRRNGGDPAEEGLIRANLERARALPPRFGDRFILVDVAARQLWLYRDEELLTVMRVAVGKPAQPTPIMAGLIRHAIFNPYWNVPGDLVRTSVAGNVLAKGLSYLADAGMVVFDGYADDAAELDPATVDWAAVRRGDLDVRVRQKPGPRNMMGKVKLMLPNPLGIYLHDTPNKAVFDDDARYVSSGCVRLADALALAGLLFGLPAEVVADPEAIEQKVDFDRPIPVYITYFTAMPGPAGLVRREDIYGRDAPLLAELGGAQTLAAVAAP